MTELNDELLWDAARAGDVEAFGIVFDRHHKRVYNHCFRLTASWSNAEDVTSEVFLTAWRRRSELAPQGESALPLLLGIANRVAMNSSRSDRRRDRSMVSLRAVEFMEDVAEEIANRIADEQTMSALLRALSRLRPVEQQVVHLCLWTGLSYQEAAESLGKPIGTIRSTLSRSKEKLRRDPELLASIGHDMSDSTFMWPRKGEGL